MWRLRLSQKKGLSEDNPHFKTWSTKTNDNEMFTQRFE